ncbi:MAG: hypothetical protein K2L62_06185 [Muribaculaceae bacterium]|nr:hypothetical protein [Muribaculaceae bacterium]MDE6629086.1 hypothetical protein [Muribaculaceae bacterium]
MKYDTDEDITELFIKVLREAGSVDMAEAEFKKMTGEDDDLHRRYRDWCMETGNTERRGFIDYCEEYLSEQDSVWENLSDFDE